MIGLWLCVALAGPDTVEVRDHRGFLDQAKFFVKRGWFEDAEEQLVAATRHPDGKVDPEVWFLLARVRYELADLPGARAAADQALTWSRDEAQTRATREWLDFLGQRFGMVELVPPRAGLSERVELTLEGTILDPELKAWYARALERLDGPVDLPLTLGLPAGYTYRFDDVPVEVEAGQTTSVAVDVTGVSLQSTELQISAGIGGWASRDLGNLFPAPQAELGVVVPVGPVVLGARAGAVLQPREDPVGDAATGGSHTISVELGLEDPREDSVQLRAGGSLRHFSLPGLRAGCAPNDGPCVLFSDDRDQRELRGMAWAPGLWTSATWLDRSRSRSLGVGLRVVAERALGTVPEGPIPLGEADSIPVRAPATWQAWGVRGLLDVSWAL